MEKDITVKNKELVVPSSLLNYGNVKITSFFIFHINKPVFQNWPSFIHLTTVHTLPPFTVINYLADAPCEVANHTFAINLGCTFF